MSWRNQSRASIRLFLLPAVVTSLVALVFAAFPGSVRAADPAPITGLSSPSHPDPDQWYRNNDASFVWDAQPGISYSSVLDQQSGTDPDALITFSLISRGFPVEFGAGAVAIADFNGDGAKDVAAASGAAGSVHILLNDGDGELNESSIFQTQSWPLQIGAADLNGDGHQDLLVVNDYVLNEISVFLGNGDGTFVSLGVQARGKCFAIADVDGDGTCDLVANAVPGLVVRLGQGDGTFGPAIDTGMQIGRVHQMDTGDFNGDGMLDVVLADWDAEGPVTGLGDGAGHFGSQHVYTIGQYPWDPSAVVVGDLNGDNNPDLGVVMDRSVCTMLGAGDGTFALRQTSTIEQYGGHAAMADMDGDGALDLVLAKGGLIRVYLGDGSGLFCAMLDARASGGTQNLALADMNADGRADVVTGGSISSNLLEVLLNQTGVPSVHFPSTPDGVWYFHVRATDGASASGPTSTRIVRVDATRPSVYVDAYSQWTNEPQTVIFSGEDATSGIDHFESCLDAGATWQPGGQLLIPAPSDHSGDGSHWIQYRSVDRAGNVSFAKDCSVRIDTVPPVTGCSLQDRWYSLVTPVSLSPSDSLSGLDWTEYQIDDGDWNEGTSVRIHAAEDHSTDGLHTFRYHSYDIAGNEEPVHEATVRIDTVAPTTVASVTDGAWFHGNGEIQLTATDNTGGSGMGSPGHSSYRIDSGIWRTGGRAVIDPASNYLADGAHTVSFRSTDAAGNVEQERSVQVRIDTVPPVTKASDGVGAWHNRPVPVELAASDQLSGVAGITYSIDGGREQKYEDLFVVSKPGRHPITYFSTDNAGGVETEHESFVGIDTVRPRCTALRDVVVQRGKFAALDFRINDASPSCGWARPTITVKRGPRIVKTIRIAMRRTNANHTQSLRAQLSAGRYTWTVTAVDAAGNRQTRSATRVLTVR